MSAPETMTGGERLIRLAKAAPTEAVAEAEAHPEAAPAVPPKTVPETRPTVLQEICVDPHCGQRGLKG